MSETTGAALDQHPDWSEVTIRRPLLLLAFALVPAISLLYGIRPHTDSARADDPRPAREEDDRTIPGRYIVTLRSNVNPATEAADLGDDIGFEPDAVYTRAIYGFAADMSAAEAARVAQDPQVLSVEPDGLVAATLHENLFQTLPTGIDRADADNNVVAAIGGAGTDANIDVAVLDSGVDTDHPDLNIAGGTSVIGPACIGDSYEDDNGHGTHVAGTIGAKDDDRGVVGIAPGARIWAVKVLNSSGGGSISCVIDGVDWVTDRRAEFNDGAGDGDPGINLQVANMSLGGSPSVPMCNAIASAVATGVIFAVAAGNENMDAINSGPANCTSAITVSAFADFDGKPGALQDYIPEPPDFAPSPVSLCDEHEDDTFACFSNFGPTVDIAAPGVDTWSTYLGGMYGRMSGTSMATPVVTGALALLRLGGYAGDAQPANVMTALGNQGWTRTQSSACGFTGDTDGNSEPVLFLGSGDCFPTGTPTPVPTATPCPGDGDCDTWSDAAEQFYGTDPQSACPSTLTAHDENPDSWPLDTNDDKRANTLDLVAFLPALNTAQGYPGYAVRVDLNRDARVNTLDMVPYVTYLNTACS